MSARFPTRPLGYGLGLILAGLSAAWLTRPEQSTLLASGPLVEGHAEVACEDCHTEAPGTTRQQLQANARHLLGLRERGADFVHAPITNDDCDACHQREGDLHPTYRFKELRFAEVRETLDATKCVTCHAEHSGQRVTAAGGECVHCHEEIEIDDDPTRPTHAELLRDEAWGTCMRCHDFHGNHAWEVPDRLDGAPAEAAVQAYLIDGPSPYGEEKRSPGRSERADENGENE